MNAPARTTPPEGRFLSGDMMGHVLTMSFTAAIGLVAMFAVDLTNMMFISWLGDPALVAGIGFASTILFFNASLSIGLMITSSALVARRVGMGQPKEARQLLTDVLVIGIGLSIPISLAFYLFSDPLLALMGARGEAYRAGQIFLHISLANAPVSVAAMIASGFLRGHGEAKRAMMVTLAMAISNAIATPLLLFFFKMGVAGAAWGGAVSAVVMLLFAFTPIFRHHGGLAPISWPALLGNLPAIRQIMVPSVLTNLATPLGGILMFRYIASYGDEVTSAYVIIGRIVPAAFCLLFALSGAVGPIIGQNYGANNFARVRDAIAKAMQFSFIYVLLMWPVLWFSSDWLAHLFGLGQIGAGLLQVYMLWVTPLFVFTGTLFVANAAFNNLGKAQWSTWLNWLRNTLGIIPFAWAVSKVGGAEGVIIGQGLGGVLFGIAAYYMTRRLVDQQEAAHLAHPGTQEPAPHVLDDPVDGAATASLG